MLSRDELSVVAKHAVIEQGEIDEQGVSMGNCHRISLMIRFYLRELGYDIKDIELFRPMVVAEDGGFSSSCHEAIYLPKQNLIIDTQVWQYTKRRADIARRKVVFRPEEYFSKGVFVKT